MTQMPWYARTAATSGRPFVLATALLMCVPAERQIAKTAGWHDPYATGMPLALSAYAGIAAVVAGNRPRGTRGRFSAVAGAAIAIILALAAQVTSHLISTGHMNPNQAWLVAVVSAVPPAVAAHILHLAATPTVGRGTAAPTPQPPTADVVVMPPKPAIAPPAPAAKAVAAPTGPVAKTAPAPAVPAAKPARATVTVAISRYDNPVRQAIRDLYDNGYRPGTKQMQDAVAAKLGEPLPGSTARWHREKIEKQEPHLAALPAAPAAS